MIYDLESNSTIFSIYTIKANLSISIMHLQIKLDNYEILILIFAINFFRILSNKSFSLKDDIRQVSALTK